MLEMLITLAVIAVVAVIAIPISSQAIGFFRLSGDARKVANTVTLAKMRAASSFTRARVYVDLTVGQYHLETYRKTGAPGWAIEGGATTLSPGVSLGYSALASPPPDTQGAVGQAPPCLADAGTPIANTACVVFNSRGIPVDASNAPTTDDALYVTDGTAVYAVTVIATGNVDTWRSAPYTANWSKQ